MPSLHHLDALHRLNAPTRAAATRRRRIRKAFAVLCLVTAALILTPTAPPAGAHAERDPAGGATTGGSSTADVATAVKGLHLVVLPVGTAVPYRASRIDVWNERGRRLIRCAPTLPARETAGGRSAVTSATLSEGVTVALTEAQLAAMAPILADSHHSEPRIVVSACT